MEARLLEAAPQDLTLRLAFKTGGVAAVERRIPRGETQRDASTWRFPTPRLWSLEDPFLYEVEATPGRRGQACRTSSAPTSACARSRS